MLSILQLFHNLFQHLCSLDYAVHVGTVCEEGKEEHVAQFLVFVHIPG